MEKSEGSLIFYVYQVYVLIPVSYTHLRADIIQKLVRIGYLNLNKKTQILTPESLGEMVFELSLIHI